MDKIKKAIACIWLALVVTAMYFSEAWESIYWRKNGREHPAENTIALWLLAACLIPVIVMIVVSIFQNGFRKKQTTDVNFSWSLFGIYMLVNISIHLIRDKGQQIAANAYFSGRNTDKAAMEILLLYTAGYIIFWILLFVLDRIDKKKKTKTQPLPGGES